MRGRLGIVVVVGLAALAGCSGYISSLDGPQPTQTPAEPEHVAAPGVTTDGVTDPGRVAKAHAAALANRSYTRWAVTTINGSRGRSAEATELLKVGPDGNRLRVTNYSGFSDVAYGSDGSPPFQEEYIWWNGYYSYTAQVGRADNDIAYARNKRNTIARIAPRVERNVEILTLFNTTNVTQITHKGWVAYRLEASNNQNTTNQQSGLRVVAIIDAFGRLHKLRLESVSDSFYLLHDGGKVTITITYDGIGNTTVTQPAWVENAKNATAGDPEPRSDYPY